MPSVPCPTSPRSVPIPQHQIAIGCARLLMLSTAETPPPPPSWQHHRKTPLYLNPFLSIENPTRKVAVSRRKHQKSRRGCTTCKRRHIRCDEEYPRCRNCIKHQSPCAYPDAHHEASADFGIGAAPEVLSSVHELAASSDGDLGNESDFVPVSPPLDHGFGLEPAKWEMSPRSLDPYLAATIPITVAQREELIFCKLPPILPKIKSLSGEEIGEVLLGHRYLCNQSLGKSLRFQWLTLAVCSIQIPNTSSLSPCQYPPFGKHGIV